MEPLNLGIKFVKSAVVPSQSAQTSDFTFIVITILACLAFAIIAMIVIKKISDCKQLTNNPSSRTHTKSKAFIFPLAALLVSIILSLTCVAICNIKAFAAQNGITSDKQEIIATHNNNTVTCESCNLSNNGQIPIHIKTVSVGVNPELSSISQLKDTKITIQSLNGTLYEGSADGSEFSPIGTRDMPINSQYICTFKIDNIDSDTIDKILNKYVFSVNIVPVEASLRSIKYDKNSTLYNATIYGEDPIDGNKYINGDRAKLLDQGDLWVHGFVFDGWSSVKGAQKPDYQPGNEILIKDNDITMYAVWKPKYDGHRGCQTFGPENSIASMQAAADHKMWTIETDFRMTKDRQVVCIHDDTLDRTTSGTGKVNQYTLTEIEEMEVQKVNVGPVVPQYDWDKLTHEQKRIPTMDDYFRICSEAGCGAFIELKEDDGLDDSIIHQMLQMIDKYNMQGKCVVSSSKMDLLQKYRDLGGTDLVHKISGDLNQIEDVKKLGNAGIALNYKDYSQPIDVTYKGEKITSLKRLAEVIHEEGLQICYRAVDDQSALEYCVDFEIDYYPTNCLY